MILTITINPALDKSTACQRIEADKKLRCEPIQTDPGGGGINVSRAIAELGGSTICTFPAGGNNGRILKELISDSGIDCRTIFASAETREDFHVTERETGSQFRFVLPGAKLTLEDYKEYITLIGSIEPFPEFVVASGSLPPGIPDTFYEECAMLSRSKGARFILDTSGVPLLEAARSGVYLLKPNLSELCSLVGVNRLELTDIEAAGRKLIDKNYCEIAIISLGAQGAILLSRQEVITVHAPAVKRLSTVGAGDSMVGGIVWMLQQRRSLKETVQFGVACGTAATMNPGTSLFKLQDATRLFDWIKRGK